MRTVFPILMACVAGLTGCRVSRPGRVETTVMSALKHHLTVRNKGDKNPLSADARTWQYGQQAYAHYCVACHGADGRATGVPFADHISPPIPSLASREVQTYTDGQLKWILDNGIEPSGMPSSKGILSDEELWSIVVFLRHLPPEGSAGASEIYLH